MFEKVALEDDSTETVLSIDRALVILKLLAETKAEVGVRDLSRDLGYSPAVTHKILNTLKVHGYVSQSENSGRYSLGPAALQLGMAALSQISVVRSARPYLERLTQELGETSFLAIRQGYTAIYVDKEVSPNPVRMDADIGVSRPLNCTAVGKIFLAYQDTKFLHDAARAGAFAKFTPNSILATGELEQEIATVLQTGYAVDNREFHPDAICLAAPVFGSNGKLVAALTGSGLASRMEGNIERFAKIVIEKADQISKSMGFIGH